jgi:hypothetical protein
MKINISESSFTDCKTGIRVGRPDVELNIDQSWFTRCQTAIDAVEVPALLDALNLPREISQRALLEALQVLQAHEKASPEEKKALLEKSSLGENIRTAGSGASILSAILNLQASGLLGKAIMALQAAAG